MAAGMGLSISGTEKGNSLLPGWMPLLTGRKEIRGGITEGGMPGGAITELLGGMLLLPADSAGEVSLLGRMLLPLADSVVPAVPVICLLLGRLLLPLSDSTVPAEVSLLLVRLLLP